MDTPNKSGNILLVAPTPPFYVYGENYFFPIGMAYISAALKKAGFSVTCINTFHLPGLEDDLEKEMLKLRQAGQGFDYIGIGGLSPTYLKIKKIANIARNVFKDIKVVLGGSVVTCMPELILKDLQADYGILGEGDISTTALFTTLSQGGDLNDVKGIAFLDKSSGQVIITPPQLEQADLDSLPWPDYEGFDYQEMLNRQVPYSGVLSCVYNENPRAMFLFASRSCPFNCTFCYHLPHQKYRYRSVENCFAEIDHFIEKYGINIVYIADEVLFTKNNHERLIQFCRGMKERGLLWMCQTMVHAVSDETLAMMKDSGCQEISYGIENVSEKILKSFRKNITLEQIEYALAKTAEHGIDIQGNILCGDVEETWETFLENFKWWMANKRFCINLGLVYFLPNSPLYLVAKERGLIPDELQYIQGNSHLVNVTHMSDEDYGRMATTVLKMSRTCGAYMGLLMDFRLNRVDEYGRRRYDIEAHCPHCGALNSYRNFYVSRTYTPPETAQSGGDMKRFLENPDTVVVLKCLECNRRYHIGNIDIWADNSSHPQMHLTNYDPSRLMKFYLHLGGRTSKLIDGSLRVAKWKRRIIKFILSLPQKEKKEKNRAAF